MNNNLQHWTVYRIEELEGFLDPQGLDFSWMVYATSFRLRRAHFKMMKQIYEKVQQHDMVNAYNKLIDDELNHKLKIKELLVTQSFLED